MANKNFDQTGGRRLRVTRWRNDDSKRHKPQFTKRPSSKRVLKRIKNEIT
jgi:hypothetical protein